MLLCIDPSASFVCLSKHEEYLPVGSTPITAIVLVTVFSMAWYKIVKYTEKILVTRGIFRGIPLESFAYLVYVLTVFSTFSRGILS